MQILDNEYQEYILSLIKSYESKTSRITLILWSTSIELIEYHIIDNLDIELTNKQFTSVLSI